MSIIQKIYLNIYSFLKILLKSYYKFFLKVFVYEIILKKKIKVKKLNFFIIKKNNPNNYLLNSYFKNCRYKIKRFKNSIFIGIKKKNLILCSGWVAYKNTNNWLIEEVDTVKNFKNSLILYDFFTHKNFRNKGLYFNLLKYILNMYLKKNIIIYTLEKNLNSIKVINKLKFNKILVLKKKLY